MNYAPMTAPFRKSATVHGPGRTQLRAICTTLLLCLPAQASQAADKYWACSTRDFWDNNCWSTTLFGPLDGLGQPRAGDDVYLMNPYNVPFTIDYRNTAYPTETLNSLSIGGYGGASSNFVLDQAQDNLQTLDETVGINGTGGVLLSGGSHSVTNNLVLGQNFYGNGYFSVSGTGVLSAGTLYAGYSGTGTLDVQGGGSATVAAAYLGYNTGSTGNSTVTGATSTLDITGNLYVGYSGNGTLDILNGGTVTDTTSQVGFNTGGTNTVTVDGTGSNWDNSSFLVIGGSGSGTLNVQNGGAVSANFGVLGAAATGNGTVTVSGTGSSLGTTSYLHVGDTGVGTLNILAGATVTSLTGSLGENSTGDGTVTVDGPGSTWDNTGAPLGIGVQGTGELNISNGGAVTNANGVIATLGSGTVNVDGANSTWTNTGDLTVGIYGGATLDVTNGGSVSNINGFIANLWSSDATVTVAGTDSTWSNTGSLTIGNDDAPTGIGTLNVQNGGDVDVATLLKLWDNGVLNVTGASVSHVNAGSLEVVGGTVTSTGGIIDITGALTLSGGANVASDYGYVDDIYTSALGVHAVSASLSGAGTVWDTPILRVGDVGLGTITVASGAVASNTTSTIIGDLGGSSGELIVNAGGAVDTGGNAYLGYLAGSGSATVGGTNAQWDVGGGLYVGGDHVGSGGTGILAVNNGGTVTAGSLTVWNGNSSITTGTATGGVVDIAGALTLTGGGTATSYNGFVDDTYTDAASGIYAGSASLDGNSTWNTNYTSIGNTGLGTATVTGGATLDSFLDTYVGVSSGSSGELIVNANGNVVTGGDASLGRYGGSTGTATVGGTNAQWGVTGGLFVGGDNTSSGGAGTLTVNDGGTVTAGSLKAWNGSSSISTGSTASSTGGIIYTSALDLVGGAQATSYYGFVDDNYRYPWSGIYTDSASLNDTSSTWDTGYLIVGQTGVGTVAVGGGATLASAYDTYIGTQNGSIGEMNVNAGGNVDTNWYGYLGKYSGSTGTVTVGGTNAQWNTGSGLYVGGDHIGSGGAGTLTVNDGGTVTAGSLTVWNGNSSISTGSTTSSTGGVIDIAGTLTLTGGAHATSYRSFVDDSYSSTISGIYAGSATLSGTTTLWESQDFEIGAYGIGDVSVADGALLKSDDFILIGAMPASDGALHVNAGGIVDTNGAAVMGAFGGSYGHANVSGAGALWDVAGGLYIGGNASGSGGTGQLEIDPGGTVNVGNVLQIYNGIVILAGGTLNADTIVNSGSISFFAGALNLTASDLLVDTGSLLGASVSLPATKSLGVSGTTTVDGAGALALDGGSFTTGSLVVNNGGFLFNSGTFNLTGADLTMGAGGPFGSVMQLDSRRTLNVTNTSVIDSGSLLTLDGGTFSTGSLVNNGTFAFNSGTFNLTGDNLAIGSGGLFGGLVQLSYGQTVNVTNTTTVDAGSVLALNNAVINSGTTDNNGQIVLDGFVSSLGGGTLNNAGTLTGSGNIGAVLANAAGGNVQLNNGDSLNFTAAGNSNSGNITLGGGTAHFTQDMTNSAGGFISGRGTLLADGGLTNQGSLGLSGGFTDLHGDINNDTGGAIIVSGNGTATFYDDVVHNGSEIRVSNGSSAVFFGAVSGSGPYTGTGSLFFEGDLNPGSSPGLIDVEGSMSLGSTASTFMELGGLWRGTEYDAFDVGAALSLGGLLEVALYDLGGGAFTPSLGDSFDLFLADTILGSFDALSLAVLGPGLGWQLDILPDVIGLKDAVRLSVVSSVPLPPAAWLFLAGLFGLVSVARRRAA